MLSRLNDPSDFTMPKRHRPALGIEADDRAVHGLTRVRDVALDFGHGDLRFRRIEAQSERRNRGNSKNPTHNDTCVMQVNRHFISWGSRRPTIQEIVWPDWDEPIVEMRGEEPTQSTYDVTEGESVIPPTERVVNVVEAGWSNNSGTHNPIVCIRRTSRNVSAPNEFLRRPGCLDGRLSTPNNSRSHGPYTTDWKTTYVMTWVQCQAVDSVIREGYSDFSLPDLNRNFMTTHSKSTTEITTALSGWFAVCSRSTGNAVRMLISSLPRRRLTAASSFHFRGAEAWPRTNDR